MSDPQHDPEPPQNLQPGQPYAQPGQPYAQPGQPYAQPGQPPAAQPGQPYAQPGHASPTAATPSAPQAQPHTHPGQPYSAPGQPYGGQPYGGQPYGGQPYGGQPLPYAQNPAGTTGTSALGRTALLVTTIAVVFGLLSQVITPLLYSSVGYTVVDILSTLVTLVVLVGAATGLVLGIVALRRPAPHLLAAIAIGIGGSAVAGTLVSWVSTVFHYLGY